MAGETPLMIVDGKGVVVEWSHQAEELLGRPAGEVVGRPATDLVSPVPAPGGDAAERCRHDALRDDAAGAAHGGLRVQPVLREDGSVTWGIFPPPTSGMAPGIETAVLEALSAHTAGALFVVDEELHVVSANAAHRPCPARAHGRSKDAPSPMRGPFPRPANWSTSCARP